MKILIIGGLGHLGFELTKLIKSTMPDSQVTIVDDLSGDLFNYDQKLAFLGQNNMVTGVFKDLPTDLHTYDLAFNLAIPRVSDFGYKFPTQPVNSEVIRQAVDFYKLPCRTKVIIADYIMGRLLIRPSSPDISPPGSYLCILPECIGGVNVNGSILYSMREHLKGSYIAHKVADKTIFLNIIPTVDALFSILQSSINRAILGEDRRILLYKGSLMSMYIFKRKCVVALCIAYPEAAKEVTTREGLVFQSVPNVRIRGDEYFEEILRNTPDLVSVITLDNYKRVDMAVLKTAQTAVKFHLAGV